MMLWILETILAVVAVVSRLLGREIGFQICPNMRMIMIQICERDTFTIRSLGVDEWDTDVILTHSHKWPKKDTSAYCLSWSDVLTAINLNFAEIRAVYPHKVVRIKRPVLGWPDPNEFGGSALAMQDTLQQTRWEELFIACRSVGIDIEVVNHGRR